MVTPTKIWGADLRSLLLLCNIRRTTQLPYICKTVDTLKKDSDRAAMEAACCRTTNRIRFRPPCITYAVVVMVVALAFHTKYPDRVGDALNIFLFPIISPSVG